MQNREIHAVALVESCWDGGDEPAANDGAEADGSAEGSERRQIKAFGSHAGHYAGGPSGSWPRQQPGSMAPGCRDVLGRGRKAKAVERFSERDFQQLRSRRTAPVRTMGRRVLWCR